MCDISINKFINELNLDNLLSLACDKRGVSVESVKTKNRKRELSEARFAFFILASDLTNAIQEEIGRKVDRGRCDVIHANKNMREIPAINEVVSSVKRLFS